MSEANDEAVAIIGSGGIGGFLAGELVRAGRPITLCVRTSFERLTIETGGETREVPVTVATDPASVRPSRWVLLTTKAQDTEGAAPWLAALASPRTTVVVVQNGLGHRERVVPIAAGAGILPAIVYCSVERTTPGHIVHHGAARLIVPKGDDSAAFARLFEGTAFEVQESDDFTTVAWRKLFGNLVGNAVTALTIRRSSVLREPAIRDLAARILAEALAVAQAEGARLTQEDVERVLTGLGGLGAESGTSMLYDRLAGRPLEHRGITGALVEAADRRGVDVPVNRALLALLDAVSGQRLDEIR